MSEHSGYGRGSVTGVAKRRQRRPPRAQEALASRHRLIYPMGLAHFRQTGRVHIRSDEPPIESGLILQRRSTIRCLPIICSTLCIPCLSIRGPHSILSPWITISRSLLSMPWSITRRTTIPPLQALHLRGLRMWRKLEPQQLWTRRPRRCS